MFEFTLEETINGLNPESNYRIGIGYVILPEGIERDRYITNVFENNICYLFDTNRKSVVKDVFIDKMIVQDIVVPEELNQLGSPLIYLYPEKSNLKFVVSSLKNRNDFSSLEEKSFRLFRKFGDSVVEIYGKGKGAELQMNVYSKTATKININSRGTKDSQLNITTTGKLKVRAENELSIEDSRGNSLKFNNSGVLINNNIEEDFETQIFVGKDANEPAVLGNQFKQLMSDFIDEVAQSTVLTGDAGVQPLINANAISVLKTRLNDLLSQYVNVK